jgi:L-ascorbate metabolism protein UlaG (beta-lactamase superfamily)
MGHASSLLEIDGHRILIDPMWSARCSPFVHIGPRRFYPPPIALADLPALDAVVLSHDHYDHLDFATVQRLAHTGVRFVTSLGVGAHLDAWGVAAERITELDWEETTEVAGLQITALPARHFSGRRFRDTNTTLWSSWSIAGRTHRVFYSGDSGYFDGFRDIGIRYGPFDLTLMAIGAYGPTWPDVHMTPEEAVHAHRDVRGHVLMPVHWGTFNLAFHGWQEPADRLLATAQGTDLVLVMPRPGERVEPTTPSPVERWWAHAPV